jgi:predicted porin
MKKTLLAISLLGTFGAAFAQTTDVTVYGTLDAGVASVRGADTAGTVTSVESGQESYSRLGFKGTEDLGGGLKAIFDLEAGFELNNGTSGLTGIGNNVPADQNNSLFSSQAYVGLAGNFGTVKVGRQFSPLYEAYGSIDPFVNGFAANINNFFGTDANNSSNYERMSNAAVYETPDNLYGFKGSVAYGFGGVAGDTSAQSQVGGSLGYLNGPLTVSYAFHQANNEQNGVPGASTDSFKTNFLGAAYDFGPVKAHLAFDQNQQGDTFKTQDYLVGLTVPIGAHAIFADYTHKDNKLIENADADQYAIGYTYNFSKRTNFYTAYTYVKNQENSLIDTQVAGNSVGTVQVGLRHSF